MGYNTDFSGTLYFTQPLTIFQETALKEFLGADCREHPEWGSKNLTYIDLEFEFNKDNPCGLQWNGSEKTYDLTEKINLILQEMRKQWPEFSLKGSLEAHGEEWGDNWLLYIGKDGLAHAKEMYVVALPIECPHCHKPVEELIEIREEHK